MRLTGSQGPLASGGWGQVRGAEWLAVGVSAARKERGAGPGMWLAAFPQKLGFQEQEPLNRVDA